MGALFESLGALILTVIAIALAAFAINTGLGMMRLNTTESNLVTTRMLTQQLFYGTDYADLDNELAINSQIAGEGFIKSNQLRNEWGGDVTLAGIPADSAFSIELTNIPRSACTKLARFQRSDSWRSVSVNGADVSSQGVAAVAGACGSDENTITFTSY